jgi:hypothetical protein
MPKRYTHDHVICKCGCIVKQNYITKHLQTNKHERWLAGFGPEPSLEEEINVNSWIHSMKNWV